MHKSTITALGAGLLAIAAMHVPKAALAGVVIQERGARAFAGVSERRGKVLPMKHKHKTTNPPDGDRTKFRFGNPPEPDKHKTHRRR